MIRLTDISDQVTDAVSNEIRRANARLSNFEMGLPAPGDESATAHFERIIAQLEVESIRVTTAMNEQEDAVRRGREALAIGRDSMLS